MVVPGILGSRLVRNGQEIWGLPGGIARNLAHPEATLALDGDGHDVDPSVSAAGLVQAPVHFPGLAKVDGLRRLVRFTRQRVASSHVFIFAYDWRLSNRVNGRLLGELVEQWRRWSRDRNTKIVLICHSMGGLVARAFLDLEGGAEQCRRLVTVGTPYFGSVKALGCLVNGVYPWAGRIGERLTEVARTWPSVYELLPTYPAVVERSGGLASLWDTDVPGLDRQRCKEARAFHDELRNVVKARQAPPYEITAVIGHLQPTEQFARVTPGGVRLLTEHGGVDLRGDGTVPRQGACPPDWDDDSLGAFFAHTHLSLPGSRRMFDHLHAVLTAVPRPPLALRAGLAIDVPELVMEGEPFEIAAEATESRLAIRAKVAAVDGGVPLTAILEPRDGRQVAAFDGLAAGTYLVTVSAAHPSVRGVEWVTDAFTVWPRYA